MDCREWNRTDNALKIGWTSRYIFRMHLGKTGTSPGKRNTLDMGILTPKIWQTPQCWRKWHRIIVMPWQILPLQRNQTPPQLQTCQKNSDLTFQLGQSNAKLAEAQSSISTLTSKLAKTGTRPNRPTTIPTGPIDMTLMEKDGYCWSYGFKMKQGHNSSTCRFQR